MYYIVVTYVSMPNRTLRDCHSTAANANNATEGKGGPPPGPFWISLPSANGVERHATISNTRRSLTRPLWKMTGMSTLAHNLLYQVRTDLHLLLLCAPSTAAVFNADTSRLLVKNRRNLGRMYMCTRCRPKRRASLNHSILYGVLHTKQQQH